MYWYYGHMANIPEIKFMLYVMLTNLSDISER